MLYLRFSFYPSQFFVVVAAEYIAKGYRLSDDILERAIAIDSLLRLFFRLIHPNDKRSQKSREFQTNSAATFEVWMRLQAITP